VLDAKGLLDIERYGRVNVDAAAPESLYADRRLLDPTLQHAIPATLHRRVPGGQLRRSGNRAIYLRIESGTPVWMDGTLIRFAVSDPDTLTGIRTVAPGALCGAVPEGTAPQSLQAKPRPRRADARPVGA